MSLGGFPTGYVGSCGTMQVATRMTLAEYLALDVAGDTRWEWVDGAAYAISGGRPLHAAVTLNVSAALRVLLRGRPCRPTSPDQRIHVQRTRAYPYPDVSVIRDRGGKLEH